MKIPNDLLSQIPEDVLRRLIGRRSSEREMLELLLKVAYQAGYKAAMLEEKESLTKELINDHVSPAS